MNKPFKGLYKDNKVLVIGHTGFKGFWFAIWLKELGAEVIGYALDPPSPPVCLCYDEPKMTFDSNVGGTVNVFETVRKTPSVKAWSTSPVTNAMKTKSGSGGLSRK